MKSSNQPVDFDALLNELDQEIDEVLLEAHAANNRAMMLLELRDIVRANFKTEKQS